MSNTYYIYLISDSTGETLDRIFTAIKAQFKNIDYKIYTYSFTRTENQILKILSDAEKYSDTIIDSFNIEVGLFNGMFKAFSGSDWGLNVKSRLGLMKILSIKIFNSKNNVNGFIGRVVNLIEIDNRKFTVVKVLNGYVYIGEVSIENEICDLCKLVKIGTQL